MTRARYCSLVVAACYCFFVQGISAFSQPIPVEAVPGHNSYYYQHSFARSVSENSRTGIFHTSSILFNYDESRSNEIMSQSYLTYALSPSFSTGIGTIYVPASRFRPSVFLQFLKKNRVTTFLLFPRADVWEKPSFELMGFVEHRPWITEKFRLYSRVQLMTTWTLHQHTRSYQYVRLGAGKGKFQAGIAINYDEYGKKASRYSNYGLFFRNEF